MYICIDISFSTGTRAATQVEDGNFRLSTRFLEPRPVTSSPVNQKKSHTPQPSPQILPIKTLPRKPLESSGFLNTSCLFSVLGPAKNLSLLQIPMFGSVWPPCIGQQWLYSQVWI